MIGCKEGRRLGADIITSTTWHGLYDEEEWVWMKYGKLL